MQFDVRKDKNKLLYYVKWNHEEIGDLHPQIICESGPQTICIKGDKIETSGSVERTINIPIRRNGFERYEEIRDLAFGEYSIYLVDNYGKKIAGCEQRVSLELSAEMQKEIIPTKDSNYVFFQLSSRFMIPRSLWGGYVDGMPEYLFDFPEMRKNKEGKYVSACLIHSDAISRMRVASKSRTGLKIVVR